MMEITHKIDFCPCPRGNIKNLQSCNRQSAIKIHGCQILMRLSYPGVFSRLLHNLLHLINRIDLPREQAIKTRLGAQHGNLRRAPVVDVAGF